jgi:hypothetical protein
LTNDIVFTTSSDGMTWSAVRRIPIDPKDSTVNHFITGIAIDPATGGSAAHLGVTYYYYPDVSCTVDSCRLYAGFVGSSDGGAHWSKPVQILGPIRLRWLPAAGGRFVGDYVSTSFAGGKAYTVIANAKRGACTLGDVTSCREFMVAPTDGLTVGAGTIPIEQDRPVVRPGQFVRSVGPTAF